MQHYGYGRTVLEAVHNALYPSLACKEDRCRGLMLRSQQLQGEQRAIGRDLASLERDIEQAASSASTDGYTSALAGALAVGTAVAVIVSVSGLAPLAALTAISCRATPSVISAAIAVRTHLSSEEDRGRARRWRNQANNLERRQKAIEREANALIQEMERSGCDG